jgi:hypothetical protein
MDGLNDQTCPAIGQMIRRSFTFLNVPLITLATIERVQIRQSAKS